MLAGQLQLPGHVALMDAPRCFQNGFVDNAAGGLPKFRSFVVSYTLRCALYIYSGQR